MADWRSAELHDKEKSHYFSEVVDRKIPSGKPARINMLAYPAIDPVALSIGPVRLHWYGLMYVIAFFLAWLLGRYRASPLFIREFFRK